MICSKCNIDKSFNEFKVRNDTEKLRGQCKERRRKQNRNYRRKNKEIIYKKQKEYIEKNREKVRKYLKQYQKNYYTNHENRKKRNEYQRKRRLEYRKENPSKRNLWTEKEIQYIKEHAKNKTYAELASDLNRSHFSTEQKMRRLNIKPKLITWTEDEIKYIKNNAKDKTYREISNDLCRTYTSVLQKMNILNITPKLRKTSEWLNEEIQYIKEHAKNKTYAELASDLNRTKLSVERKVTRLHIKVKRCPHKEWPDDNVKYLQENEGKKTYYELASDLNKSAVCIRKKMNKLNIKPKQHPKYKKVNHDFFKTWSEEMSYILGLWFADGNILSKGKRKFNSDFTFNISSNDLEIIEKINNIMNSTYSVSKMKKNLNNKIYYTYRITFSSKEIYNDIIKLGGCERKSLILKFPDIPDEYIRHFIRGYFDGDGSIRRGSYKINYPSINFSGTYNFLYKLMTYFPYRVKIKHKGNIYIIDYHGEKAQDILKYMYENATIYLNRKYERYQDAMKWFKVNFSWTKHDIKILKEKYPENSYKIPELLERHTEGSIRTKASQLNIKIKKLNQNVSHQKV